MAVHLLGFAASACKGSVTFRAAQACMANHVRPDSYERHTDQEMVSRGAKRLIVDTLTEEFAEALAEHPASKRQRTDGWSCDARRSAESAMDSSPAAGARGAPAYGAGHRLWISGAVVWCQKCGLYAEERAKGLAHRCQLALHNAQRRNVLAHLRDGQHPRSGRPLGRPQPIL